MLSRCLVLLVFPISAHLSLCQESGKANPRVPATKPLAVVSKVTVYVAGDVHSPMGVAVEDTGPSKRIRFYWIDPDHGRSLPTRVVKIVNWFQSFKAVDAFPVTFRDLSDRPIAREQLSHSGP
jgi:hypothetical protein